MTKVLRLIVNTVTAPFMYVYNLLGVHFNDYDDTPTSVLWEMGNAYMNQIRVDFLGKEPIDKSVEISDYIVKTKLKKCKIPTGVYEKLREVGFLTLNISERMLSWRGNDAEYFSLTFLADGRVAVDVYNLDVFSFGFNFDEPKMAFDDSYDTPEEAIAAVSKILGRR